MDIRDVSAVIRETVPAREVAKALGLEMDRHGRCACPFHHGSDRNMKIYEGNRGYYCFVCHKGGDCISLVTGVLTDCSYADAVWWINDTFGLGLFRGWKDRPNIWQRDRRNRERMKGRE